MLPVLRGLLRPSPVSPLGDGAWHHNQLPLDALTVSIRQEALLSVLPGFARRLESWTYDTDSLIDQLIVDSPELWPRTRWNYLEGEDFRRVYHWIIKAQSRSSYGEVEVMVGEGLLQSLERSYQHDRSSSLGVSEQFFHRHAQRLFRSLAEVSRQTESLRLGGILANWFVSRATHIATTDNCMALGQWCYAIVRATMRETDRQECLLTVLRSRPDLPSRLIGRGAKAEEVVRSLQVIERLSTRRNAGVRSNGILLGGSRGDDMLLNLDVPEVRSRVVRSRSHDGRLVSPLDGLDRARGLFDLGSTRGRAERALFAEGEMARQEQRLLQLSMGRRFADHFDRDDPLGFDALGLGDRSSLLGDGMGEGGLI